MSKTCHACGQFVSDEHIEARRKEKGRKVSAALARRRKYGLPNGRPKKRDDKKITELRRKGLSMRKIAALLKCSTHTVHVSIKANMKPGKIEYK